MSEDQATPSLHKYGNRIVISDGSREVARVEATPSPWQGALLFVAGIVCAPLFLVGIWFACWLIAGMPR